MTNQFEYTPDQYLSLIYHRIGLVVRTEPSTYVTNIEKQKKDFGQFFRADVLFPYLSDEIALQYSALMKPKEELLPYWKTDPKGSCLPTLLLGVSGSGKTHTITEYGAQGFILYFTAAMRPQDKDFYSTFMVGMVEKEMNRVALTPTDYTNGIQLSDKKEKIGAKVIQFFLFLKLAALLCLLKKYPNMTPGMFFFDQLNGRSKYYLQLMYQCQNDFGDFCKYSDNQLIRMVAQEIRTCTQDKFKIGIAFDECNVYNDTLSNYYTSTSTTEQRGLYTAIARQTNDMLDIFDVILEAGTSFSLNGMRLAESAHGEGKNKLRLVFEYLYATSQITVQYLRDNLNVEGCEKILEEEFNEEIMNLNGRFRLTTGVLNSITTIVQKSSTKEQALTSAMKQSYNTMKKSVTTAITEKLQDERSERLLNMIINLCVAMDMTNEIKFEAKHNHLDFMALGLCHLQEIQGTKLFVVAEMICFDIVPQVLLDVYKTSIQEQNVIYRALDMFKGYRDNTMRGKLLEPVIVAAFSYQGVIQDMIQKCDVYTKDGIVKDADKVQFFQQQQYAWLNEVQVENYEFIGQKDPLHHLSDPDNNKRIVCDIRNECSLDFCTRQDDIFVGGAIKLYLQGRPRKEWKNLAYATRKNNSQANVRECYKMNRGKNDESLNKNCTNEREDLLRFVEDEIKHFLFVTIMLPKGQGDQKMNLEQGDVWIDVDIDTLNVLIKSEPVMSAIKAVYEANFREEMPSITNPIHNKVGVGDKTTWRKRKIDEIQQSISQVAQKFIKFSDDFGVSKLNSIQMGGAKSAGGQEQQTQERK
ncbi:hypothetical protein AKO1_010377, partial [Acrasis kona]